MASKTVQGVGAVLLLIGSNSVSGAALFDMSWLALRCPAMLGAELTVLR